MSSLEVRYHTLVDHVIRARPAGFGPVANRHLLPVRAVEDDVQVLKGEIAYGGVEVDVVLGGHTFQEGAVPGAPLAIGSHPGHNSTPGDRESPVGHDQLGIELPCCTQPSANRAGSVRRVEREV